MSVPRALALSFALLLGLAMPAWAEPPGSELATEQARVAQALARLASPLGGDRQDAQRQLIALLPGAREAVRKAWADGDEGFRTSLVDVVAADASPEMLHLLFEAWRNGGEALASRVRSALLRDPDATRRALEAMPAGPPRGEVERRPLAAIGPMLDRDEVERSFLARKSRSGHTGFYRGQYEVLRPRRELALEVCLHIVIDRALRLPGTASAGGYRFLRPIGQVIDVWEVRGMALNALLDLARPDDVDLIRQLDDYMNELSERPAGEQDGDVEREALLDDLLATLYRLAPTRYERRLRLRVAELEETGAWSRRGRTEAAQLALRAGWYDHAVRLYTRIVRGSESPAHDHYNLACAYACWAMEPGSKDPDALKRAALLHLERAVDGKWGDVGWMDQDRDLDPIRDTPTYRALRERILERFKLPDEPVPDAPLPPGADPHRPLPAPVQPDPGHEQPR